MIDVNLILSKEKELFAFREMQYDSLSAYLSKSEDEIDLELAKYYTALSYEFQHLTSLFEFLDNGLSLETEISNKLNEIYKSVANNYYSLGNIYDYLALTNSTNFWYKGLRDSYIHLGKGYSKEAESFKP